MKVIIEHLDPEVWKWSLLEYTHISKTMGKENVIFTNVPEKDLQKLKHLGAVYTQSVHTMKFKNVCILDPESEELLNPEDDFEYFLFGGVLGNHPMDGRTKKQLSSKLPHKTRHLGDVQMSTNTAVLVTKKIIKEKIPFNKIDFLDELEIKLDDNYSNVLPYRYVLEDGEPILPEGLIELLKEEENEL